jgi:hypothetical protein
MDKIGNNYRKIKYGMVFVNILKELKTKNGNLNEDITFNSNEELLRESQVPVFVKNQPSSQRGLKPFRVYGYDVNVEEDIRLEDLPISNFSINYLSEVKTNKAHLEHTCTVSKTTEKFVEGKVIYKTSLQIMPKKAVNKNYNPYTKLCFIILHFIIFVGSLVFIVAMLKNIFDKYGHNLHKVTLTPYIIIIVLSLLLFHNLIIVLMSYLVFKNITISKKRIKVSNKSYMFLSSPFAMSQYISVLTYYEIDKKRAKKTLLNK